MATADTSLVTQTLRALQAGDARSAQKLLELVYDDFRALAGRYLRREGPANSLQATELVHEAYLKLVDQTRVDWVGRSHFQAVGAIAMRRILTDRARARKREKRGGDAVRVTLSDEVAWGDKQSEEVLAVDEALRELEQLNERHAKIVEMRFFGGLTIEEAAAALRLSEGTVKRDWRICKAWIRQRLATAESA